MPLVCFVLIDCLWFIVVLGSLSNDDGHGNENGKKAIGKISKTTTLHVHQAFLYIFCRHCTITTWKCLLWGFVEDVSTRRRLPLSFPDPRYRLLELTPETVANIWRIERDEISAIKFEAKRLHFLIDVFVPVAVVVARRLEIRLRCAMRPRAPQPNPQSSFTPKNT